MSFSFYPNQIFLFFLFLIDNWKMKTCPIFCTPVVPIPWVEYGLMSETSQLQHNDELVA